MLYHTYLYAFRPFFLTLGIARNINNITAYEPLVEMGFKFLPFWNMVSMTYKLYINNIDL